MVIQGSNNPLVIKFSTSVEDLTELVVSLWDKSKSRDNGRFLRSWRKADMTISGDTAVIPMTEQLTQSLPPTSIFVLAKGLNEEGETVFWDEYVLPVKARLDKGISLTRTEG